MPSSSKAGVNDSHTITLTVVSLYRGVLLGEGANKDWAAEHYDVTLHYYDRKIDKILIWTDSDVHMACRVTYVRDNFPITILAQVQEKVTQDGCSTGSSLTTTVTQTA
jgi:hypothetical protein